MMEVLPPSLEAAEKLADNLLKDHLEETLKEVGQEEYFNLVIKEASRTAKKLYLLRCFIASEQITAEPNKIEIYKTELPKPTYFHKQEHISYNNEEPIINETEKKPYQRALEITSKQQLLETIEKQTISVRDILPEEMKQKSSDMLLKNYGIHVSPSNVWEILDRESKRATIKDRIIGRLLYLIENANAVKRGIKYLGDPQNG